MSKTNPTGFRSWPYRTAWWFAASVFPLIWLGGLVTTSDAGMAVPDWPNTYGYNLFLYPIYDWFFGPWDIFVEHGHRLLATLSGLIAIIMVLVAFRSDRRAWFIKLAALALILVIVQGILGGLRVVLDQRQLAKFHGCLGPVFFAVVTVLVVTSSRWWFGISERLANSGQDFRPSIVWPPLIMLVLSFGQLVIGAHLRHVAVDADPTYFRSLVASHLFAAAALLLVSLFVVCQSVKRGLSRCGIRNWAWTILAAVVLQIALGLATWVVKYGWPAWMNTFSYPAHYVIGEKSFGQMTLVTSHVAVGSLILAFSTVIFVRALRLTSLHRQQLDSATQRGAAT